MDTPLERRLSTILPPPWLEKNPNLSGALQLHSFDQTDRNRVEKSPAFEDDSPPPSQKTSTSSEVPKINLTPIVGVRHRGISENFENAEVEELIAMLRESESLEEQGDILQYLVDTQGLDFNTGNWGSNRWENRTQLDV